MEKKILSTDVDGQDCEKIVFWRNNLLDLKFDKNDNRKNKEDYNIPSL